MPVVLVRRAPGLADTAAGIFVVWHYRVALLRGARGCVRRGCQVAEPVVGVALAPGRGVHGDDPAGGVELVALPAELLIVDAFQRAVDGVVVGARRGELIVGAGPRLCARGLVR